MTAAKKTAYASCFLVAALALAFAESFIPTVLPGVKPGIANSVTLLCLYFLGYPTALAVGIARVLISALLFGSLPSAAYGFFGSLLSVTVMLFAKKLSFGAVAVSAFGGVFHNIGQIAVACVLTKSPAALSFLPVLVISGALFGALTGLISAVISRRLKNLFGKEQLSAFSKRDVAALAVPLIAGAFFLFPKEKGELVTVTADGQLYGSYPLSKDARITVESKHGTNVIVIQGGKVRMESSSCAGGDCLFGSIDENGGSIVCLPNRVTVKTENQTIDGISG